MQTGRLDPERAAGDASGEREHGHLLISIDRRSKIMATLGPASRELDVLRALLEAGVEIVRLNLSHGTHAEHSETVERVRRLSAELERHVPIVFDLTGPRYRLGRLPPEGLDLLEGQRVVLGGDARADLPLGRPEVITHLGAGERVLIDGGRIELRIEERHGDSATAQVLRGGTVTSHKGMNLPETKLTFEVTAKDRDDIAFAVAMGVDLIGASYVASPDDLARLREAIAAAGGRLPLIAKIERAAAIDHIEAIVGASDAVMVARGDLGVEVPFDLVPVLQKRILAAGRATGTPVVVATDMLASMVEHRRPTRAEVSDVAHAVFDGADVLMLSGETAIGRHPVEAVQAMARTIQRAEGYELGADRHPLEPSRGAFDDGSVEDGPPDVPDAIAAAAARVTKMLDVRYIVAFTQSGSTARLMARYRPAIPIVAFASDERVARSAQLLWGVEPHVIAPTEHHEDVVELIDRELLRRGRARPGDLVVVLMGAPIQERPRTNLLRIHRIGRPEASA